MMAAILNSAMFDSYTAILHSDTFVSCLRFTQKHSRFTLILPQTNSIWLTWWWQPSWILPSWIQPFCPKLWLKLIQSDSNTFILTQLDDDSHLEFYHVGFHHLYSAILVFPLKLTHTCQDWFPPFAQKNFTHSLVPTICMKKLHSFILNKLDDGSHLEFCHLGFRHCHLGFRHLVIFSQIHSKTLSLYSDPASN